MANDFSLDTSCVSVYNAEAGLLGKDSKGTNDLSIRNVLEDAVNYKEGSGSAFFRGPSSYGLMYLEDTNLSSAFPLRSTDTKKTMTLTAWVRPKSLISKGGAFRGIIEKSNVSGANTFRLAQGGGSSTGGRLNRLLVYNGYNSGGSWESYNTGVLLVAEQWYHISIVHDGVNKTLYMEVYDVTADTLYQLSHSWGHETNVEGAAVLYMGIDIASSSYAFHGNLDEVVFFNRLKRVDTLAAIRAGTYAGYADVEITASPFSTSLSSSTFGVAFNVAGNTRVPPPSTPRYPNWMDTKGDGPFAFSPMIEDKYGYCNNPRQDGTDNPVWTTDIRPVDPSNGTKTHWPCGHWHHNYKPS